MNAIYKQVIIFSLLILLPLTLYPQEGKVLGKILKRGELIIGTSGNQPPFAMLSKDNQLIGYEIDLARLLAEALNLKLTFFIAVFLFKDGENMAFFDGFK